MFWQICLSTLYVKSGKCVCFVCMGWRGGGGGIQEIYQNILGYTFYSFGFVSALLSFCCSESSLDVVLLLLLLLLQLLFATKLLGFEI